MHNTLSPGFTSRHLSRGADRSVRDSTESARFSSSVVVAPSGGVFHLGEAERKHGVLRLRGPPVMAVHDVFHLDPRGVEAAQGFLVVLARAFEADDVDDYLGGCGFAPRGRCTRASSRPGEGRARRPGVA